MPPRLSVGSPASELQRLHRLNVGEHLFALGFRERNQAPVGQVTELTRRRIANELLQVLFDARDHADVSLLHVEEQRPGDWVTAIGNRIEVWHDAVYGGAVDLVLVLVEEAVTEDAERIR